MSFSGLYVHIGQIPLGEQNQVRESRVPEGFPNRPVIELRSASNDSRRQSRYHRSSLLEQELTQFAVIPFVESALLLGA